MRGNQINSPIGGGEGGGLCIFDFYVYLMPTFGVEQ